MKKLVQIMAIGLLALGCNGGYSTQESNQICKDDLESRMIPTSNKDVFEKCVLCYEECTDCRVTSTEGTVSFACPVDE